MEKISLPRRMEQATQAAEWRRRAMQETAELDWSAVEEISEAAAEALLKGLDLGDLPDGFGIETLSEALAEQLMEAHRRVNQTAHQPRKKRRGKATRPPLSPEASGEEPEVWSPPPSDPPPAPGVAPGRRSEPPARSGLVAPTERELRALLEERVLLDLLGPAGGPEEEVAEGSVRDRYLVGLLAPGRLRVEEEQLDELQTGGDGGADDGDGDGAMPATSTVFPSSIGLSFCIPEATTLRVRARWGRYRRQTSETQRDKDDGPLRVWKRSPMEGELLLKLEEGPLAPQELSPEQPGVTVSGVVNRAGPLLVASLFLVNGQEEPKELRDQAWLFQPELIVEDAAGEAIFRGRPKGAPPGDAPLEDRLTALGYRKQIEFAVGHGVASTVEVSEDPRKARRISTVVVPRHEVGAQRARIPASEGPGREPEEDPKLAGVALDMRELAETPREELRARLLPIVEAYGAWIEEQEKRLSKERREEELLGGLEETAVEALRRCRRSQERIRQGIELVCRDEQAAEAFRFANRAMWLQRVRGALAERRRRGEPVSEAEVDLPRNRTWRTFQLAFLLQVLEGLTRLDHPDRSESPDAVADLLWFPTGGGKTEAYLGATAYVLGLRRLQGTVEGRSGEHGVAVLMRYTLRLLTLQQFQRATALICACEYLRRKAREEGDERWGQEPFRVGLWVGARSTPNRTAHADEALKRQKGVHAEQGSAVAGIGSPVQLKSCPWCGVEIDPGKHLRVEPVKSGAGRTLMHCGDPRGECPFSRGKSAEGLPVLVVDEEIYRLLPSLLIATVDKFAQMPWKGEVQMLFGQVDGRCTRHGFRSPDLEDADRHNKTRTLPAAETVPHGPLRPPDLIIQDELHLISGPLGTLTGLYETAVDELCTWQVGERRVRPKVIASTATVRRATQQVHAIFQRRVEVFPPQGLDAGDNFFSIQRSPGEVPGRRYLGICAPGRRLKAALIRVYVAFLSAAQQIYEEFGQGADPWMTLVGYFGSLRELAGMRRLVDDDIRSRLRRMDRRGLAPRALGEPRELTSRLGSTEIPQLLDLLEVPFDPAKDPKRGGTRPAQGRRPIDVLLATNMISVGVDVQRLGLMVCAGQPKTTAEYIQATSRVGRRHPGLVCTLYNWSRPRDLSHYETFEQYHGTFYQHVEALSVTPFASRALDRGLSALLVALVRLSSGRFNGNDRAREVLLEDPVVRRAIEVIARRAELVEESKAAGEEVRAMLVARAQQWKADAAPAKGKGLLSYRAKDGLSRDLLKVAGLGRWEPFTCLESLRDVEPGVSLVLSDGGLDDEPATAGEEVSP